MDDATPDKEAPWPERACLLAVVGALVALAIERLADLPDSGGDWGKRLVGAASLFLGIGGIAFALGWQRGRAVPALAVAALCGLVSGGVFIWNGPLDDGPFFGGWPTVAGLVASGVMLTLFQASESRDPHAPASWSWSGLLAWKRRALSYADVHEAMWTGALLLLAALIFTGILWLVSGLLVEMFALVKIEAPRRLLRESWFTALLAGTGFGGAIGLLRERAPIIAALQRVAMMVLRVLAPVLAFGLAAFLAVLPFTGLAPLWATGNTTGLMLGAAVAALFLVNAVIGDSPEGQGIPRTLRRSAWVLGLALAPLVLIAAWSTGLRVGQHGLSPDRLWAIAFIAMGFVTALAYAWAILRPGDPVGRLHRVNLDLAVLLGFVALILSTPILGFERISTANQTARLASGKVKPIDFDYRALWFDFGPPGRAAIRRLATESGNAQVRRFAAAVQKGERFQEALNEMVRRTGEALDARLIIRPDTVPLEPALRERLTDYDLCGRSSDCLLYYVPGASWAVVVALSSCSACEPGDIQPVRYDLGEPRLILRGADNWTTVPAGRTGVDAATRHAMEAAVRGGRVEVRTVERRQLFVDGKPVGEAFQSVGASENDARP